MGIIKNLIEKIKKHNYFPKYSKWVFTFLFLLFSLIYNYHHILFKSPQSNHLWRQCDCLSITMNYYQDNNPFLEPSVHYLGGNGTGKTVSDFPLIYFSVAQLWKVFGYHEFIYRLVILLFFFSGLFLVFKIFENVLKDSILAITCSLFLFTSPTLVYYANNFLMDMPAFSLALVGFYFFFLFHKSAENKQLYLSALSFSIAGLLKISSLLGFIAIVGLFILEQFNLKLNTDRKIFQQPKKASIILISVLIIQAIWYIYAKDYNAKNNAGIFLIGTLPIWDLNLAEIKVTLNAIKEHIKWDYFRKETQFVFVFMLASILFFYKAINKTILFLTLIISFGFLAFILLFFQALKDHDYYTINLFIQVPVILLSFLLMLKNKFKVIYTSVFLKIILIAFLIYNGDFARRRVKFRYKSYEWENNYYTKNLQAFEDIIPFMRLIGIKKEDRVLSLSDNSINISLYKMNQKGWTNFGILGDSVQIKEKIRLGAKYLFIYNKEQNIEPFIKAKIGQFKNIEIYELNTTNTL